MALVQELEPARTDQWAKLGPRLCARGRELGQSWTFRTGLNEHLFTGAVVDSIEKDMVIEGLQEELKLEVGPPLEQELLVSPLTKTPKPNVISFFKNAVMSIKESERESQERQLLIFRKLFRVFLNP